MNDPDEKAQESGQAETLSGMEDELNDTGTTMRLQTLQLEGELWPDGESVDPEEDVGVNPYNSGRCDLAEE